MLCKRLSTVISNTTSTFNQPTTVLLVCSNTRHRLLRRHTTTDTQNRNSVTRAEFAVEQSNKQRTDDSLTGTGSPNVLIGVSTKIGGINSDRDEKRVEHAMSVARHHSVQYDVETETALPHPIWPNEYIDKVQQTHKPARSLTDKLASYTIRAMRFNFDWMSGWSFGKVTEKKALRRICFLESVAGVPGSVAGIIRHLASLRRLKRDNGWIHTLFEEAENERMHLLTYMTLKQPTRSFKAAVWMTQGVFFNFFFLAYIVNPTFCHRMVGYLEESAVTTYTHILHEIDGENGGLKEWKTKPAPQIAIDYWKMKNTATMRDVIAVTRADEAHHRDVNHAFAGMAPDDSNPFKPGH